MRAGTGRGRLGVGWIVSGVSAGVHGDARGDNTSCAWGLREVVFVWSEDGRRREMEGGIRESALTFSHFLHTILGLRGRPKQVIDCLVRAAVGSGQSDGRLVRLV
jgi:hypothetical protein